MVNFNSDRYKNMSKSKKLEFIDNLTKKADEKIADAQLLTDLVNNYKTKLSIERAKN